MSATPPSSRATVRTRPARADYDRAAIDAVLDEGLVAHVAIADGGQPHVIPMAFARDGDRLLLHGSKASRLMKAMAGGAEICVMVTLLDGLVLARSAFHTSVNYRSVAVYGRAREIAEAGAKREAFRRFVERVIPGRWDRLRPVQEREIGLTLMVELPLDECVLKQRSGPPIDDDADYAWPVWAGVLPLRLAPGAFVADPRNLPGHEPDPALAKPRGR